MIYCNYVLKDCPCFIRVSYDAMDCLNYRTFFSYRMNREMKKWVRLPRICTRRNGWWRRLTLGTTSAKPLTHRAQLIPVSYICKLSVSDWTPWRPYTFYMDIAVSFIDYMVSECHAYKSQENMNSVNSRGITVQMILGKTTIKRSKNSRKR